MKPSDSSSVISAAAFEPPLHAVQSGSRVRDHRAEDNIEEGPERGNPLDSQLQFEFARDTPWQTRPHDSDVRELVGNESSDVDDRVVMVVDDDHAIREALKDLLGILGFQVVSARDGEDALALLGDGCKPFAILLDLGMPRMDGWRFRNELLSDPRYADLRVIVITASENQHPDALGVSDVLTKPVPLQRLVEVLGTQASGPP